jgi:hypothetical protein
MIATLILRHRFQSVLRVTCAGIAKPEPNHPAALFPCACLLAVTI